MTSRTWIELHAVSGTKLAGFRKWLEGERDMPKAVHGTGSVEGTVQELLGLKDEEKKLLEKRLERIKSERESERTRRTSGWDVRRPLR